MCEHRVGPRWLVPFLSVDQRGPFCYTKAMDLAILIGIGAFVILGIMFALLWASGVREEREDTITQEVIIKANTGIIDVHPGDRTQEEKD